LDIGDVDGFQMTSAFKLACKGTHSDLGKLDDMQKALDSTAFPSDGPTILLNQMQEHLAWVVETNCIVSPTDR
jgi:hypothetical protein